MILKNYKRVGVALSILMTIGVGTVAYATVCSDCIGQCMDNCATASTNGTDYINCAGLCPSLCSNITGEKCVNGGFGGGN